MTLSDRLRRNVVADTLRDYVFGEVVPLRVQVMRTLHRRFGVMKSYRRQLDFGMIEKPYYGHGMLHAAILRS